jgi:hypothetical protein
VLVFDGDEAVAWCEYGSPEELPNIYHRKQYEAELDRLADYRITSPEGHEGLRDAHGDLLTSA